MLVNITVNQDGFIGIWIDKPKKLKNIWKGNFAYVNSLVNKKIKDFVEESQMNWESEIVSIPI